MARKKAAEYPVENEGGAFIEPLLTRPDKVAIVALGNSWADFVRELIQTETSKAGNLFDEVWTVNRGLRAFAHDKLFVMDDFKWLETHKDERKRNYAEWLKKHDRPIVTSTVYSEYPMAVEYPIHDVAEFFRGDDIFTVNTISYMVAFAISIGVKELSIYGADFFYPGGDKSEQGGQAVAYLLGVATGMGIIQGEGMHYRLPNSTSLLYANKVKMTPAGLQREPYGYHRRYEMERKEQKRQEAENAIQTG